DICAPIWKKYMTLATSDMKSIPLPKERGWPEVLGLKKTQPQTKIVKKENQDEESEEEIVQKNENYTFKKDFRRIMESVTPADTIKEDANKNIQAVPTVDQQYEELLDNRKKEAQNTIEDEQESVIHDYQPQAQLTPRPVRKIEENPYIAP